MGLQAGSAASLGLQAVLVPMASAKKTLPKKKLNSPGASGWEADPFCLHDSVLKQAEQEAKPMQSGSFAEVRRCADASLLPLDIFVPLSSGGQP